MRPSPSSLWFRAIRATASKSISVISRRLILSVALAMLAVTSGGAAEFATYVGGGWALLNIRGIPQASLILIPGGDGRLEIQPDGSFIRLAGNQLVRTRQDYLDHGIATLTVDREVDLGEAVAFMRRVAQRVVVIATSRGSLRLPTALPSKPDAIVLTSAFLAETQTAIGDAALLPRTLVVHHRRDGCWATPPDAVTPFKDWGGPNVTVVWFDGGLDDGDPCEASSWHGFSGLDVNVVAAVAKFALENPMR